MELVVEGDQRPLDPGLAVSAYRIIQEALTNSLKHAGGGHARVVVRYAVDALEITIDGRARPGRAGHACRAAARGPRPDRDAGAGDDAARHAGRASDGDRVPRHGAPADRRRGVGGMSIRVLLVDDQALVRTGFRMILADEEGIEVVGEAANGREAVDAAPRLRPDVVVMDIRMPVMDGVEATRRLTGVAPGERARGSSS